MYGTQAFHLLANFKLVFENDVKMYGTQAITALIAQTSLFENDVKMYGTQAVNRIQTHERSLRMM